MPHEYEHVDDLDGATEAMARDVKTPPEPGYEHAAMVVAVLWVDPDTGNGIWVTNLHKANALKAPLSRVFEEAALAVAERAADEHHRDQTPMN